MYNSSNWNLLFEVDLLFIGDRIWLQVLLDGSLCLTLTQIDLTEYLSQSTLWWPTLCTMMLKF